MNIFTKTACLVVRLFGGEHKMARRTVPVQQSTAVQQVRLCVRCGFSVPVKHRKPKADHAE